MIQLIDKFRSYIGENDLLTADDRVLLAVSGGVDSMVMLSLFAEAGSPSVTGNMGWPVAVAHCNFGLRGAEGDDDTELVKAESKRYGLTCYTKDFDTLSEAERTGESIQMVARRLRYKWFGELCAAHGYTAVAIAHQADDSVETFFINLFRGTGLRGLTGISQTRGLTDPAPAATSPKTAPYIIGIAAPDAPDKSRIVRPLLSLTRREIVDYATARKIRYREDSSNRSTKYLRNKIRLGLVPRLREINPRFTETMRRNVDRLTQSQHFIDAAIARIRADIVQNEGARATIDTTRIDPAFGSGGVGGVCGTGGMGGTLGMDSTGGMDNTGGTGGTGGSHGAGTVGMGSTGSVGFVIYELLSSGWGFRGDVIDGICSALESGTSGRRFYSRDYVAFTDRGRILIEPIAADDPCIVTLDEGMTRVFAGNSIYYLQLIDIDAVESLSTSEDVALIDADRLMWPMSLRRWREGDRFVPLGMIGSKKVSDYLIDTKISLPEKGRQFVLVNGLVAENNFLHTTIDGRSADEKNILHTTFAASTGCPRPGDLAGEIIWLTGRRLDDRFKITPETENVLKITREII